MILANNYECIFICWLSSPSVYTSSISESTKQRSWGPLLNVNWYKALQACASISVSKLYNFHLPYLLTFVSTLFLGKHYFLAENSEILIFAIYLVWKGHFFVEKRHVSAWPRILIWNLKVFCWCDKHTYFVTYRHSILVL